MHRLRPEDRLRPEAKPDVQRGRSITDYLGVNWRDPERLQELAANDIYAREWRGLDRDLSKRRGLAIRVRMGDLPSPRDHQMQCELRYGPCFKLRKWFFANAIPNPDDRAAGSVRKTSRCSLCASSHFGYRIRDHGIEECGVKIHLTPQEAAVYEVLNHTTTCKGCNCRSLSHPQPCPEPCPEPMACTKCALEYHREHQRYFCETLGGNHDRIETFIVKTKRAHWAHTRELAENHLLEYPIPNDHEERDPEAIRLGRHEATSFYPPIPDSLYRRKYRGLLHSERPAQEFPATIADLIETTTELEEIELTIEREADRQIALIQANQGGLQQPLALNNPDKIRTVEELIEWKWNRALKKAIGTKSDATDSLMPIVGSDQPLKSRVASANYTTVAGEIEFRNSLRGLIHKNNAASHRGRPIRMWYPETAMEIFHLAPPQTEQNHELMIERIRTIQLVLTGSFDEDHTQFTTNRMKQYYEDILRFAYVWFNSAPYMMCALSNTSDGTFGESCTNTPVRMIPSITDYENHGKQVFDLLNTTTILLNEEVHPWMDVRHVSRMSREYVFPLPAVREMDAQARWHEADNETMRNQELQRLIGDHATHSTVILCTDVPQEFLHLVLERPIPVTPAALIERIRWIQFGLCKKAEEGNSFEGNEPTLRSYLEVIYGIVRFIRDCQREGTRVCTFLQTEEIHFTPDLTTGDVIDVPGYGVFTGGYQSVEKLRAEVTIQLVREGARKYQYYHDRREPSRAGSVKFISSYADVF